ncbi:hypothetical protein [Maribacter sp. 2307ULW6-5]|uniref:DUF7079 family protein n=1 Tax=Maribacter sp. 2307ULW6-5 TaxID=3386275 RepID=UPI0039BD5D21
MAHIAMHLPLNIEERKPVWAALSDFYLDTELQEDDFAHIARTILASPYSWEEVKHIDKYEVFPVLQPNLLSVAGEWAGFDEDGLAHRIAASLSKRNALRKIRIACAYLAFRWMCKAYWEKLESAYRAQKSAT